MISNVLVLKNSRFSCWATVREDFGEVRRVVKQKVDPTPSSDSAHYKKIKAEKKLLEKSI